MDEYKGFEEGTLREFNLRIKNGCISPCTVSYNFKAKNRIFVNGTEIFEEYPYWFDITPIQLNLGDTLEVVSEHPKSGNTLKTTVLELEEIRSQSLKVVELAKKEFRKLPRIIAISYCASCKERTDQLSEDEEEIETELDQEYRSIFRNSL